MWQAILNALLKTLETDPMRIITLIEKIVDLLASLAQHNPQAAMDLIGKFAPKQ